MDCLQCGHANRPLAKFCDACGTPMVQTCPHCQHEVRFSARFCDQCGQTLASSGDASPLKAAVMDRFHAQLPGYTPLHLTEKILAGRSAMEGERKQVTVLFADVTGFTRIAEALDPEDVHQLMDGCFTRLTEAVHGYEGTVNQYTGDGIMALFGAPIAHEDHPQRALLAALAIQESMRPYSAHFQTHKGIELRLRIGVNTGLVVVGRIGDNLRMDYTAQGDTTNLAARLQSLAEPGSVLVGQSTYQLTQGLFSFLPMGERQIRGHSPLQVFQLLGRQRGRARIDVATERGLTAFIGRQREFDLLKELLEKTQGGHGQIVGIFAEAGMGKSRLLLEFRHFLGTQNVTYMEGRCLSYGQSILYLPIVDMLKRYFAVENESDQSLEACVISGIEQIGLDAATTAPYLTALLTGRTDSTTLQGLAPEVRRKQTFVVLRAFLLALSRYCPLVLIIEDPHWIDQPSEAFLTFLGESLGAASIMMLLACRPGYAHAWGEKSYYSQIALNALGDAESGALIAAVLGVASVPSDLQNLIIRKAEGNPFYLEEITRSFLERGIIQRDADGYKLSRSITTTDMPGTIQDIIASRIDRLPDAQKHTIQTAAVIGREFAANLLRHIVDIQEHLDDCLSALRHLELIYEKEVFPNLEYTFRHGLTQEAAYNSLLIRRRKGLHTAIGLAMETLFQERLAEHYEEIAHHFLEGEAWSKAFLYLRQAGDKARQVYANHEALAFYTRALEVSERITPAVPEEHLLPIYEAGGLVRLTLTQYDEAIADFQMMLRMAQALGNQRQQGESLCHLAFAHWSKFSEAHFPFVEQYAREALQLAQQTGDQKILARSLASLGFVHQMHGNLPDADRTLGESLDISRREGYRDTLAQGLMFFGHQAYWQGHFDRAISVGQEGLAVAREVHDGFHELYLLALLCLAYGSAGNYGLAFNVLHDGMAKAKERDSKFMIGRLLNSLGWLHSELGDVTRAAEYDQESVELGRTSRMSNVEISALINLGLDFFALGQPARALSHLEPTLDRVEREAFGAHRWRWKVRLLIGLAEVYAATGDEVQAWRYAEAGLQEAHATSSQKYVAKGWAVQGQILAHRGDTDAAVSEFQRAYKLAESLHSPALLSPLAAHLGRLYEMTGREQEAVTQYATAQAAIERMAASLEEYPSLRHTFLQSVPVLAIYDHVNRHQG